MRKTLCTGSVLFVCMMFRPAHAGAPEQISTHEKDPRLWKIEELFDAYKCPIRHLAPVFLRAAEMHHIDWRLLPSLAVIESGGGKVYSNNNIFGWGNGGISFESIEEGIDTVGFWLANSDRYRGKSLDQILNTYNPVGDYKQIVKTLMGQLGPKHTSSFN